MADWRQLLFSATCVLEAQVTKQQRNLLRSNLVWLRPSIAEYSNRAPQRHDDLKPLRQREAGEGHSRLLVRAQMNVPRKPRHRHA